jgi:energy-coupling factor transporter transmembrane protein EcfT
VYDATLCKELNSNKLRMVLKSKFNVKKKIRSSGALAVPVLKYSFDINNLRLEEIKNSTGKPEIY